MTEVREGRAYGGLAPDQRDAQRKQRLLDAALEMIGTGGYAATTIPRVCALAKVSTRNFYEMYSTKEDLFIDLYDRLTASSYERVAESLTITEGKPVVERIPAALLAYLDPMLIDPRVARIAFVEIMGASQRIEQLRLDYRETLVKLVTDEGKAAVRRGEAQPRDWRFVALALVGAVTAIVYDWARQDGRKPSRAKLERMLAEHAVQLFVG